MGCLPADGFSLVSEDVMLEPIGDDCRRGEVHQGSNQDRAAPELIHLDEGCVPATFGTMMVITCQSKRAGRNWAVRFYGRVV